MDGAHDGKIALERLTGQSGLAEGSLKRKVMCYEHPMLDAQTISAFESFATWDNPFEGALFGMTPSEPFPALSRAAAAINERRGSRYLERLQARREKTTESVHQFKEDAQRRAIRVSGELKALKDEDREEARIVLSGVVSEYEAIGKRFVKIHDKALKGLPKYRRYALEKYPANYRGEFANVFADLENLIKAYMEAFLDSYAALKAFAAELDPETNEGPTFSSASALEQHLENI